MRTDFILDNNNNLIISDGDWLIGNSDQQNVELIFISYPGMWKQNPLIGCGIYGDINGNWTSNIQNYIKNQLNSDGYSQVKFNFNQSTSQIDVQL